MIRFIHARAHRREQRALCAGSAVMLRRHGGFYSLVRVGAVLEWDSYLGIVLDSRGPGGLDPRLSPGDCVQFVHGHAFRLPAHFLKPTLRHRTTAAPGSGAAGDDDPLPDSFLRLLSLIERSSRPLGWASAKDDFEFGRLRCAVCDSTAVSLDGYGKPQCESCARRSESADDARERAERSLWRERFSLLPGGAGDS